MVGLSIRLSLGEASSDMKIAEASPSGTAKTMAPKVTRSVPTMSGTVPNFGITLVGSHLSPVRNGIRPISMNAGIAS